MKIRNEIDLGGYSLTNVNTINTVDISALSLTVESITADSIAPNLIYAGPGVGPDSAPTFRAIIAADLPSVDLTTGIHGILPIANGGTGVDTIGASGTIAYSNGTTIAYTASGSDGNILTLVAGVPTWSAVTGTVSSVGLSLPSIFDVTGSPVTSSGTLAADFIIQTINHVFAAPFNTDGVPTFRLLTEADLPIISLTTGVSGILDETLGGTGTNAYTLGDLLYASGTTDLSKRNIGLSGQLLTVAGGVPTWVTLTAVNGNNITAGSGTLTLSTFSLSVGGNSTINGSFSGTSSGTNTGDQTITLTGDVTGSGTGSFATAIGAGKVTNVMLVNSTVTIGSTSVTLGSTVTTFVGLTSVASTTFVGALTGNASTATALQTPRTINGTSFDGTANITVTAAAGTLTGTTLNATVVSSSLTSVGTLTGGATGAGFTIALTTSTVTGTLGETHGGTGQTVYAVGDILYANSTTTLTKMALGSGGAFIRSGGGGSIPGWSTLILPNAATVGDILFASSANTITALADVATGNALISGGVGVVPSYGKIGLTTHISGILAEANGGTNQSTYATGDLLYASGANTLSKLAIGTSGQTMTIIGGVPVWRTQAAVQSSPADPATTTSTTGVMMGLAGLITPAKSGRILIVISGDIYNATGNNGAQVQMRTGTGAAPANGAALTGTTRGGLVKMLNTASLGNVTSRAPFSLNCVITGLGIGTDVWIDVGLAAITGGTARIRDVSISAMEV